MFAAVNDITLTSKNIRNELDGTYEVINDHPDGTGIIRLVNQNDPENKTVKVYLGSDHLTIGVDDVTVSHNDSSSDIVSGLRITKDAVKIISDDEISGTAIIDKVNEVVYNALTLERGSIRSVANCGFGDGDSVNDDIKAIFCRDGSVIIYGVGNMDDGNIGPRSEAI